MELIILSLIIWASVYLGYKLAGGKDLIALPVKFKPVIRSDEEALLLEQKLKGQKRGS